MTTAREAASRLRRHTAGVLRAGERRRPLRFVVDRARGRLIAPLEHPEMDAEELVLLVPDEGADALQLLLTPEPIDEGRPTDRWLAYHARPDAPTWASLHVDLVRDASGIVDGDLDLACAFADAEPALCKHANARADAIKALCIARGLREPEPVLVGVDDDGVDIRARTAMVRIDFQHPASTADEARRAIDALLDAADGTPP